VPHAGIVNPSVNATRKPDTLSELPSGPFAGTYAQLVAFKSGQRGNDAAGKDAQGRIMASVAAHMTDTQMKALADYAAGLR